MPPIKGIKQKLNRERYVENHICKIPLQDGKLAICDEDRMAEVNKYNWRNKGREGNKYVTGYNGFKGISLHNFLYPKLKLIDHINGNTLDNRSCNLREATISQNEMNSKTQKNNKSGFKGVYWSKHNKKWEVRITINGKSKWLKHFDNPKDAAIFYDLKAKETYGEFARLNFPNE